MGERPFLGMLIAAGLTLYGGARRRRERRLGVVEHAGNHRYGRHADHPLAIPIAGWWDILGRVRVNIGRDNVSVMAAGVAFYALLSIFPAITALISLYGLAFDPAAVGRQVAAIAGVMPPEASKLLLDRLTDLTGSGTSRLSLGLVISVLFALWSAIQGTAALMTALNVSYKEVERRSYPVFMLEALALTLGLASAGLIALPLVVVLPAVIDLLPLGDATRNVVALAHWPILVVLVMSALAALYRFGPSRNQARWRWVSWGAVAATALWLAGSALFSLYVGRFASYDKTYGSLGAVVVLLMWFYVTAYVILVGAELNAEMEHQTARDTTDPPEKPLGRRGARMADTVARHID